MEIRAAYSASGASGSNVQLRWRNGAYSLFSGRNSPGPPTTILDGNTQAGRGRNGFI